MFATIYTVCPGLAVPTLIASAIAYAVGRADDE